MRWPDIAGAMESMLELPDIKPGLIPMMRQAIDEIRQLRKRISPYGGDKDVWICPHMIQGRAGDKCGYCGDGPCRTIPMVTTYLGERMEDLYRDAMRYRKMRSNLPPEHHSIIDQVFDGWGGK